MAIPDPATTEWVPIWNPLSEGPVGPAGPAGPQGIPGNAVPHHTTHEPGGIDALVNAAWTNLSNTFTQIQTIQAMDGGLFIIDPTRPVDARRFHFINSAGFQYIQAVNDAASISQGYTRIARDGSLYSTSSISERNRAIPVGEWQPYTPVWSTGGTQPTLGNGSLIGRYTLIGKTCHFAIQLNTGTTTNHGTGYYKLSFPVSSTGFINIFSGMYTIGKFYPIAGVALGSAEFAMYALGAPTTGFGIDYISSTYPEAVPAAGMRIWISGTYEMG